MKKRVLRPVAIAVGAAAAVCCVLSNARAFPEYYERYHLLGATILLAAVLFIPMFMVKEKRGQRLFLASVCLVMVLSGFLVNPVRRGISNIYESETLQQIRNIVEESPEALWVVEGENPPMINLPVMVGARTINSTNVYPCPERWAALDGGENSVVYNRYAHIRMDLTDGGQTVFTLSQDDCFQVECPVSVLRQMDVRYVFTERDLSKFTELKLVRNWDTYRIYEL